MGLFGLGGDAPAEESPTAGLPKPSDDSSTQPPKAFQGQGENDTEQRMESSFSDSPQGSATQAWIPPESESGHSLTLAVRAAVRARLLACVHSQSQIWNLLQIRRVRGTTQQHKSPGV